MITDGKRQKRVEKDAAYLRSLADYLRCWCDALQSNPYRFIVPAFRSAMMGVSDAMRNSADTIDELLDEKGL